MILIQNTIVTEQVKKFLAFYETSSFITMFKTAHH